MNPICLGEILNGFMCPVLQLLRPVMRANDGMNEPLVTFAVAVSAPRLSLYCGDIDARDLVWIGSDVFAANTRFSCISRIDAAASFTPVWNPPFISALTPDDRCHLMASRRLRSGSTILPRSVRPIRLVAGVSCALIADC